MTMKRQAGFSLVELAIVILIMGLVLGGLAVPLSVQRDNARNQETQRQLDDVRAAVEGYVLANGHLPCPATPASDGREDAAGGACTRQHGFVPATTLNLRGSRNADNLLLDPWGSPLRYSVSAADIDSDGNWDFIAPGEMSDVTMPVLQADLVVCSTAAGATATACGGTTETMSDRAPMLVYSLGKDWPSFSSPDQLENVGAIVSGGPSGARYRVAANVVFVSRGVSAASGSEFDDRLSWMSMHALFRRMVDAGHLP